MELAVAPLGTLLQKLGTLLTDEYKLQKGVRGEIQFLQAEMESMQAALSILSERPADQITKLDKIWVRDLKELSYDIEDSVDTFMVRIDAQGSANKPHSFTKFFGRTIGLLTKAKTRHHVANDIDDIKKRINDVAARRERYNKLERVAAQPDTTVDQRRAMACFEHAAKLVGTDVPVERISNLLTNENGLHEQKRMVVSIVGVGGLGKTTIANLVYEGLWGQFDCQSFVSVSLRPNMTQILSKILRQVSKTDTTGEADLDELVRKIRKVLEDKRYFIVIDDVWNEEAWKIIEGALIDNNLGSRIILTTRSVEVARSSSVDGPVYPLGPLSDKDSKKLLSIRIFNEGEGIPSHLEEVAKSILNKCGGVPLAIITIASMLASIPHKTRYEWFRVYKSMGRGLQKDDKSLESMREILRLSYGDLPPYLKPCLLYLSMFPEDYEIERQDLIRMWVGEGFVDGEQQSNLYDLGERYFRELVNRSMIQPVDVDIFGATSACRVHDMILDLIITLSAQENFVTISGGPQDISSAGKIRRLSLQGKEVDMDEEDSKKEKVILPTTATTHVRTLITFGDAFQWIPPLSSFPLLRVLRLKMSNNNTLQGLGSLHHLRYLELGGLGVETEQLEEIGNLKHLRTLNLWGTYIEELPASIVQLRQLECLITDDVVKFPDGMGNLVSLQQLSDLDVRKSPRTLVELGLLTGLRELGITGINESCVKTFLRSLNNLHNIHTLLLWQIETGCSLDCIPDQWSGPARLQYFGGDRILKVPRWFSSLSELSRLAIFGVHILRQDDLQLLGALPVLRTLVIYVDEESGTTDERLVIGTDQPFRSLTLFKFKHHARCLLVFAEGVMPKLETLKLYVTARPRGGGAFDAGGLENLTSLKQVKVKVDCEDATTTEVHDAETKLRDTIDRLPNHPTLDISRKRFQGESYSEASKQQRSDLQDIEDECHKGSESSEKSPA